jgi:hypothetical protein
MESVKDLIEKRYMRIKNKERRPGIEYTTIEDIKDIFSKYIEPNKLEKMEKQDFIDLFNDWCFKNFPNYTEEDRKSILEDLIIE